MQTELQTKLLLELKMIKHLFKIKFEFLLKVLKQIRFHVYLKLSNLMCEYYFTFVSLFN